MARRTAALVAGWNRRFPTGFANTPASGESPNGLLTVELYLGGWVDITALGLVRYASGVKVTRGKPDESSAVNPTSISMTLDNRDGRFSPRNPLGPYYGVIGRNTPMRVSVQSGLDRSYRGAVEVPSWPTTWDSTGSDVFTPIQGSGILRRLSQGATPVHSAVYLFWVYQVPINTGFNTPAIIYWPCEDGALSTAIAPAIGSNAMTITGSPKMASNGDFTISDPLPAMNRAVFTGAVPTYTPAIDPTLVGLSDSDLDVGFLLSVPSGGETTGAVVCSLATSGTIRTWEVVYTGGAGGTLTLRGKDATGAIVLNTGANSVLIDGIPVVATISLRQSGTTVFGTMAVGPIGGGSTTLAASVAGQTFGIAITVVMNPGGTLTTAAIGHVSVATFDSFAYVPSADRSGDENAADRLEFLCAATGTTYQQIGSSADTPIMGAIHAATFLELVQECVDADGGLLYELPDQIGLGYRTRASLQNQDPALTLSYPAAQLTAVPVPVDDDSYTRNDVTATRLNGSSARQQQLTGPLNVQAPPAGVGRYDTSVTVNIASDTGIGDQAGWRLHLGTADEPRYPTLAVQLAHPSFTASTTLRIAALGVGSGDRIAVTGLPSWLPPGDASQLAIGSSEMIDQFQHQISWNGAPEFPYRTAVLEDPVLGRLDTDGSALVGTYSPTDVTLSVATTTTGSPLWTTDAGDFPFDVMVGGERMTVTGITGAASPQAFTMTRSVNGVVKAQIPGTDVRLYQPMILSM